MSTSILNSSIDKLDVGKELQGLLSCQALMEGLELQARTIDQFYRLAAEIGGSQCPVLAPGAEAAGIERNFFSTFFLAVTRQLVGPSRFMPLYAIVNQGMRAWVTACDNILDDEYKAVFQFGFPEDGPRMLSVLTLLLGDRVVTEYINAYYPGEPNVLSAAGRISLLALVPSALQECGEEQRPVAVLPVDEILADIHGPKTGDLFAAPLALPLALESIDAGRAESGLQAVRSFGLACQIVDDIKDMPDDVAAGRHNLLVSMVARREGGDLAWLEQLRGQAADWSSWERFGGAVSQAAEMALVQFDASFDALDAIGIELSSPQRQAVVACILTLLRVPLNILSAKAGAS